MIAMDGERKGVVFSEIDRMPHPNSFVGLSIEENAIPGIGKAVEPGKVNDDVNAAVNINTHKDDKKVE